MSTRPRAPPGLVDRARAGIAGLVRSREIAVLTVLALVVATTLKSHRSSSAAPAGATCC